MCKGKKRVGSAASCTDGLVTWGLVVGQKGTFFVGHHEGENVSDDKICLVVQVVQHLISETATNCIDNFSVCEIAEDRHRSCGTEGMVWDVLGRESQVWPSQYDGCLEYIAYCGWIGFFPPLHFHNNVG